MIASNILAGLGGCWWPIEIMPGWLQRTALLLATGWATNGLHRLLSYVDPPISVLPHAAALAAVAALAGW